MAGKQASVSVVARLKPVAFRDHGAAALGALDSLKVDPKEKTLEVRNPRRIEAGSVNNTTDSHTFQLNAIVPPEASQAAVYDMCVRDVAEGVLEGISGTVFAYGQTGAGKTYTMSGPPGKYAERGLIPRAISHILGAAERARADTQNLTVRVSYLEIYQEKLFDLLSGSLDIGHAHAATDAADAAEPMAASAGRDLVIHEDAKGRVSVRGLSAPVVRSEAEALDWLFAGEANRAIAEHALNKASTRSHCIFTITVEQQVTADVVSSASSLSRQPSLTTGAASAPGNDGNGPAQATVTVVSKLHLVDLAGSERLDKTESEGHVKREAQYINKSLTFLEQVVLALLEKDRDHVPYRSSKLTHVLKDALGGRSRTRMIAAIWPDPAFAEETISTLRFATRMMHVKTTPQRETLSGSMSDSERSRLVSMYEREIAMLRTELALRDVLGGSMSSSYTPVSPDELEMLRDSVERFILGASQDVQVATARHYTVALHLMRDVVRSVLGLTTVVNPDTGEVVTLTSGLTPPLVSIHPNPSARTIPALAAHAAAAQSSSADSRAFSTIDASNSAAGRSLARLSQVAAQAAQQATAASHASTSVGASRGDPETDVQNGGDSEERHAPPAVRSDPSHDEVVTPESDIPGHVDAMRYIQRRGRRPDPVSDADRLEELAWWRTDGPGASLQRDWTEAKASLKQRKADAAALVAKVNENKRTIDNLLQKLREADEAPPQPASHELHRAPVQATRTSEANAAGELDDASKTLQGVQRAPDTSTEVDASTITSISDARVFAPVPESTEGTHPDEAPKGVHAPADSAVESSELTSAGGARATAGDAAQDTAPDAAHLSQRAVLLEELAAAKAGYRAAFDDLNAVKSELAYLQRVVDQVAQQLAAGYNEYWVRLCLHSDAAVEERQAQRTAAAATIQNAAERVAASAMEYARDAGKFGAPPDTLTSPSRGPDLEDEESISRAAFEGARIRMQATGYSSKRLPGGTSAQSAGRSTQVATAKTVAQGDGLPGRPMPSRTVSGRTLPPLQGSPSSPTPRSLSTMSGRTSNLLSK